MVQFDFKKKGFQRSAHKISVFCDSLAKPVNAADKRIAHSFHKAHDHLFTLGCDATDFLPPPTKGQQPHPSQQTSLHLTQLNGVTFNQNFNSVDYFQGAMSLPFMLTKFELDKVDKQND
jgi:hypothetical protein